MSDEGGGGSGGGGSIIYSTSDGCGSEMKGNIMADQLRGQRPRHDEEK